MNMGRHPLFLPYLEMHGVRMIDYACNGGDSRERERQQHAQV